MKRLSKQPAFGIVGTPAVPVAAAPAVDEAVAHGFVPRERLCGDSAGTDDPCVEAVRHGRWQTAAATLPRLAGEPDRYHRLVCAVARVAVREDGWLNAWLDAAPGDAGAWAVHGEAMVYLAWQLRTGAAAKDVLPEQWAAFRRVLRQAPAACERAAELDPRLVSPWVTMMSCARGIGWDHDRFAGIWGRATALAPSSVAAHLGALQYWLPRWRGSAELVAEFVAGTLARATPGSLLTLVELQYLYQERVPAGKAERAAYFQGPELAAALDRALADLVAAAPDHPYRAHLRHWLAYLLTRAGRYAEAVEEFRAIDGYVGAWPWELFDDAAATFVRVRGEAVRGWQNRGAPS